MHPFSPSQMQPHCWHGANLRLELYLQTKGSKNAIIGIYGERLKVTVTAPPIDGKANKQLIKFLATYFAVPQNQVQIIAGIFNHYKSILIVEPRKHLADYPRYSS